MSKMSRILLVEDNELLRGMLADVLTNSGFEIIEAATGDQALDVIRDQESLDALITDIQLGSGPDGWDVALAFREANAGKPVIYASGTKPGEPRRVEQSLFFPKPLSLTKVEAALWALLRPQSVEGAEGRWAVNGQRLARLTYMSRPTSLAREPSPSEARLALGEQASRLNREHGLTGALIVGPEYFIQVLEGDQAHLIAALGRLTRDPRHEDMRIFELTMSKERMFPDWAMHLGTVDQVEPELIWRCVESYKQPSPANANVLAAALSQSVQAAA
jgi:DNA-binding response OmpR family regulator